MLNHSNIIELTDFFAPELDIYARLNETQLLHYYEPHGGLFIAESPKVISLALKAGCTPISLLMERKHITGDGAKSSKNARISRFIPHSVI